MKRQPVEVKPRYDGWCVKAPGNDGSILRWTFCECDRGAKMLAGFVYGDRIGTDWEYALSIGYTIVKARVVEVFPSARRKLWVLLKRKIKGIR